jgi:SAM-dependent methyltransferase
VLEYDEVDPEAYEARYAVVPRERYLRAHWTPVILDALARHTPGRRVLDLGCGYGRYTSAIDRARLVVGMDLSRRWLTFARRRGVANLCHADAHHLPFADSAFDVIVSVGLLEYVRRDVVLSEIRRALAPGGVFILVAPNRHGAFRMGARLLARLQRRPQQCDEPTRGELRRMLAERGFSLVEERMDDGLVWLPDAIDRRVGLATYRAVEALFRPLRRNPLSNELVLVARR